MVEASNSHPGDTIVSVKDLQKVFGKTLLKRKGFPALRGIDLEVGRGQVFGLLGPNGAGKTTLVKVLLGLTKGWTGEARLFGLPPGDAMSRQKVGYLPEAHRLPPYLTGHQVMQLFGRMAGADAADVEARIGPLLEKVNMTTSADRKIREYSKGMQQRLGLAQALVHDPELVILDEPTDGVDPVGRASIREMVLDLKARGVTVFINSHLLMEVEMICDHVVIMDKGKILVQGSIDELTPKTGAVEIDLRETPEDLEQLLGGLGRNFALRGGGFQLELNDEEQDAVVDRLRERGLSIVAITPRRLTLEQSFIGLIEKDEPGVRP
ncbi:MAG: ABC transporter ATP-binding protein [Planctomycetes bacterium]|nr:ABC transporter ATP-binding protein [Planctomycetota bacterium]